MSNERIDISFTEAWDQLKAITERLNSEEVEADELVDLLRRAKGLEAVLRAHLIEIEQEITAIENGEGIAAYRIVKTSAGTAEDEEDEVPADSSDFVATEPAPDAGVGAKDDDIPF
jgi:exodeoxyribonuclease VII small subunit